MKKNESCRRFSPGEYSPGSKGPGWPFSGGSGRGARMRRPKHSEIWVWTEWSPFGYSEGYGETLRRWVFQFVPGRRWVYFQCAEEVGNWYHVASNWAIQRLSCSNGGFQLPLHLWYRIRSNHIFRLSSMRMHAGAWLPALLWPLWASAEMEKKPSYIESIKLRWPPLMPYGLPGFLTGRFFAYNSVHSG